MEVEINNASFMPSCLFYAATPLLRKLKKVNFNEAYLACLASKLLFNNAHHKSNYYLLKNKKIFAGFMVQVDKY